MSSKDISRGAHKMNLRVMCWASKCGEAGWKWHFSKLFLVHCLMIERVNCRNNHQGLINVLKMCQHISEKCHHLAASFQCQTPVCLKVKKKGSTKLRTTSFWQENNISRSPPFQGCQSFDVDRLAHRAEPSGFWGQTQLVQPGLRHDMKWWVFKT